jgi:hypothetical protein
MVWVSGFKDVTTVTDALSIPETGFLKKPRSIDITPERKTHDRTGQSKNLTLLGHRPRQDAAWSKEGRRGD